jgi:hypothetical protein
MTDSGSDRLPARPSLEQLRNQAKDLLRAWRGGDADAAAPFTIADARSIVAHKLGFESWERLAGSFAQPADDPRTVPHGLSKRPPFYRIDWSTNTLQPRQLLTDADWNTIIGVIREHGIVRVEANGHMTDAALDKLSHLAHVTGLDLSGSKRLTDDGLRHLARMPQLEELLLDVRGARRRQA